jgi:hypothetical protein
MPVQQQQSDCYWILLPLVPQQVARSRVWTELLPLPFTCRVTKMVRSTIGVNGVGDLLPLDFRQTLVVTQGLVVVRVDTIEVVHNEHF